MRSAESLISPALERGRGNVRRRGEASSLEHAESFPALHAASAPSSGQKQTHIHQIPNHKGPALLGCSRLLLLEEIKLATKREEMGKERIQMAFGREMKEDGVMGVIEMRKDAQELGVDVTGYGGEVGGELPSWRVE